jgi:hypothetical protein
MSRGFIASLLGIAMTLLSWYGPWAWPAWPAFTALRLVFGSGQSWLELPEPRKAAIVVVLIAINVAFWGGVAYAAMRVARATSPSKAIRPGA